MVGRKPVRTLDRKNASERPLADAIWGALNRYMEDPEDAKAKKAIYVLANRMVRDAIDGSEAARKEILDRIDGKVSATLSIPDGGGMVITVNTGIDRSEAIEPTEGRVIDGEAKVIDAKPLK